MTQDEYNAEKRHRYEERLALLGFYSHPPAWAHNLAVQESEQAIHAIRVQESVDVIQRLRELRETL